MLMALVYATVAVGAAIFILWAIMVAIVLPETFLTKSRAVRAEAAGFDASWRVMVLGFFSEHEKPVRTAWPFKHFAGLLVPAWFVTAVLSTVGWLVAFVSVWLDIVRHDSLDADPATNPNFIHEYRYMYFNVLQLASLFFWTVHLLCVGADSHWVFRLPSIFLLMNAADFYVLAAIEFQRIDATAGFTVPGELKALAAGLLFVHAAHGWLWDALLWGFSYAMYGDQGYDKLTEKPVAVGGEKA